MSTNDIDIENQSAIVAPSTQPEIQETVPMAVPEDPQSQEKQYNERGDTGGKYPYIDKIIELSKTQERYEAQARKWQHELNLTSKSEFEVVKTYTSTFDQLFSFSFRSYECENPCCYSIYCRGCVESPICAIFDFTSDDNLSVQGFTNTEFEDKFCEALEAPSSKVKTRIILVTLWNTSQTSEVKSDDYPHKTDFWPNMPGAKLTNFLGTKYDLDPLFFDQIMSDRERDFWSKFQGQEYGERRKSSTRYTIMNQIEPKYLFLGFDDGATWDVAPRLWGVTKIGCPGPAQKTVILFHLPRISGQASNNVFSALDFDYLGSMALNTKERVSDMIERIQKLGSIGVKTANNFPLNFLIPVLETFELHFVERITSMDSRNRISDKDSSKETDIVLRRAWEAGRSAIEDFQIILDQIDDYSDILTSETADTKTSKKLNLFMKRCRRTLSRARLSEQYLRDKIQINVGTLSLEESRKSIQQANSIGRISFLGFVFLPLSLVMSFYGMNINEITGSGASWRAFVISTSVLCFVIFVVCSFIFRGSEKVRFISLTPVVPFLWVVWLASGLMLKRHRSAQWSGWRRYWYHTRKGTGRFVDDWWKARLAFVKSETGIKEKR